MLCPIRQAVGNAQRPVQVHWRIPVLVGQGAAINPLLNERPGGALDAPETVTAKLCKGSRVFLLSQRNCFAGDGQGSCVRYGHGVLGNLGFGFSAHARVFM